MLGQGVQATVDFQLWKYRTDNVTFALDDIPKEVWLPLSLSPLLVVLVNEAVKLHEIRYEMLREAFME